jgi:hypothetical protein
VPLAPAGPHPKAPQGRREAEHVAHLDVVPHGRP